MEQCKNLTIPQTVAEACDPDRMAVLVYDIQVGVVDQLGDAGVAVVEQVRSVIDAARSGGIACCTADTCSCRWSCRA